MNKKLIKISFLILGIAILSKLLFVAGKNIKVDDFHKASVIFLLESTAQNNNKIQEELRYIKSLCAILDPEDAIKILKVSQTSYLIFEGSPSEGSEITKAVEKYTKNETQNSTSYSEGIKKAIDYSLTMKKNGYVPAVVVVGSLEDYENSINQINWKTLPKNIKKTKEYLPDLTMMFVYADPEKLDEVKTNLNPVLGETKLIIASEINADKANRRFLQAIGR